MLLGHLDELAATRDIGERGIQALREGIRDVLADAPHDVIETVCATTPGTHNLVVRFGIRDTLRRALARAAQDFML
jgi:hypothetical protein